MSKSARLAAGSKNTFPGRSMEESPPSGRTTATGPRAWRSLRAMKRPISTFSAGVVRMVVMVGLWKLSVRPRKRSGT